MASSSPARRSAARSKSASRCAACPATTFFACAACRCMAKAVDRAGWGQRVAMNLTGPERADHRTRPGHLPRKDLRSPRPLRRPSRSPSGGAQGHQESSALAHSHGRSGTLGKDCFCSATTAKPSRSSRVYCQITLDEPLLALRGDRFVARDETARRTLGRRRRRQPLAQTAQTRRNELLERLKALHSGDFAS